MKCAAAVDGVAKAAHSFRPHDGAWISPIMAVSLTSKHGEIGLTHVDLQTLWPLFAELSLKFPEATPDGPFTGRSGAKAMMNAMAAHASMEGAMRKCSVRTWMQRPKSNALFTVANYKRLKASIPA